LPSVCLPRLGCVAGFIVGPLGVPRSDPFLAAVTVSAGNNVVSNIEANPERGARDFLDTNNFELRGFHARYLPQPALDLLEESLTSRNDIGGKLSPHDMDPIS